MYEYFICTAKQRRLCSTPAIRVEQVEVHLARVVAAERLAPDAIEDLKSLVAESIDDLLATDGTLPLAKIRSKIEQTMLQKEAVKEKLDVTTERLKYGAEKAIAYLDLLRDPGELYRNAPESVRRELLSASFNRLIVYVEDDSVRVERERNDTNGAVRELQEQQELAQTPHATEKKELPTRERGVQNLSIPKPVHLALV